LVEGARCGGVEGGDEEVVGGRWEGKEGGGRERESRRRLVSMQKPSEGM
jgi:hypothetical protein